MRALTVCVAALLGATSPAHADPREQALVAAERSGDRAALAAAAERLGSAHMAHLLAGGPAEISAAALAAAPELDDAWTLLPVVIEMLGTTGGAAAAARIVHAVRDPATAERLEVDADVLDGARQRCAAGLPPEFPGAARADLLACAADLGVPVDPMLVFDRSPEVRAAAISLLAATRDKSWRARLQPSVAGADPTVASQALAALCADHPRLTASGLDPAVRARLRKLAATPDAAVAPQISRCLRAARRP